MGLGRKRRPGERHWLRAGGQECRRVCGGLRRPCAVRSCAAAAAAGWVVVVGMCEQGKGAVEGARPQALLPNRMMSCRENAARREGGAGVCVRENRAIAMFLPSSRPTRREQEKWWGTNTQNIRHSQAARWLMRTRRRVRPSGRRRCWPTFYVRVERRGGSRAPRPRQHQRKHTPPQPPQPSLVVCCAHTHPMQAAGWLCARSGLRAAHRRRWRSCVPCFRPGRPPSRRRSTSTPWR